MTTLVRIVTVVFCGAVTLALYDSCVCQSRNDSIRLMEDMLRGYHSKHRPVLDQSRPVHVNISFDIVRLQEFDEIGGSFSVIMLMYITWIDEVINWEPASYGGMTSQIYDVEDVWYPPLVVGSTAERVRGLAEDWMTLRIQNTGHVSFSQGTWIKSVCDVDVTYFPFDTQVCRVFFSLMTDNAFEVSLNSPLRFARDTFLIPHAEWRILKTRTFIDTIEMLNLEFELERKPLFAVVNTIMPVIVMSVLNVMVFVLPAESGERVSYTITVLLAITVFLTLVAESLPASSEAMPLMAFFLMISLFLSASVCVVTILNLRLYYKSDREHVSSWQRSMVRVLRCKCNYHVKKLKVKPSKQGDSTVDDTLPPDDVKEDITWRDVASAVDKVLFIGFLVAYAINIIVFMVIITVHTKPKGTDAY